MITIGIEDGRRFQFEDWERVRLVRNSYRFTEVATAKAEEAGSGVWLFVPESVKKKDREHDLGFITEFQRSTAKLP